MVYKSSSKAKKYNPEAKSYPVFNFDEDFSWITSHVLFHSYFMFFKTNNLCQRNLKLGYNKTITDNLQSSC